MSIKLRNDAFVIGFSFKPDVKGISNPKKYVKVWLGCFEADVYVGKYKWRTPSKENE